MGPHSQSVPTHTRKHGYVIDLMGPQPVCIWAALLKLVASDDVFVARVTFTMTALGQGGGLPNTHLPPVVRGWEDRALVLG